MLYSCIHNPYGNNGHQKVNLQLGCKLKCLHELSTPFVTVFNEHSSNSTSAAVVSLVVEVVVEVSDHVADCLLASFRVQRVLDRLGRLDEIVDVDAGTIAEDAPEHARHAKQQSLCQQYHRHPLIVADVTLNDTWLTRYGFLVGQVVRTRYPAHLQQVCTNAGRKVKKSTKTEKSR